MMVEKRILIPMLLTALLIAGAVQQGNEAAVAQSTNNMVAINIYYDLVDNYGIVTQHVVLGTQSGNITEIVVPLVNASTVNVINVTNSENSLLLYDYNSESNTVTIYANNTNTVTIYYTIEGLFDEVAPATYSGIIDLSPFEGTQVTATITLEGLYNVTVVPEGSVSTTSNETIINLDEPDTYTIIAYMQITLSPTTTPTTPPISTTISTSPSGTITGTQTTSGTSTSSPGGGGASSTTTTTSGGGKGGVDWLTISIIAVIIVIIGVAGVWLAKR